MMRSLYSGVAGLKTHQTKMDVIGNNIANVNTVAFKSSSVTFNEIYYQTTQGASGPNANTGAGGVNAKQIGLGVAMASTMTNIKQAGATQTTGGAFDIKINGDSFFIVNDGTKNMFTRAGSFYVDAAGNLAMTSTGYNVMGWQVDEKTGMIKKDTVSALRIMSAKNLTSAPEATKKAVATGVLDANAKATATDQGYIMNLNFFDALGYQYTAKFKVVNAVNDEGEAIKGKYKVALTDILDSNSKSVLTATVTAGDLFGNAEKASDKGNLLAGRTWFKENMADYTKNDSTLPQDASNVLDTSKIKMVDEDGVVTDYPSGGLKIAYLKDTTGKIIEGSELYTDDNGKLYGRYDLNGTTYFVSLDANKIEKIGDGNKDVDITKDMAVWKQYYRDYFADNYSGIDPDIYVNGDSVIKDATQYYSTISIGGATFKTKPGYIVEQAADGKLSLKKYDEKSGTYISAETKYDSFDPTDEAGGNSTLYAMLSNFNYFESTMDTKSIQKLTDTIKDDAASSKDYDPTKVVSVEQSKFATISMSGMSYYSELVYSADDGTFVSIGNADSISLALSNIAGNFENISIDFTQTTNYNNGGSSTLGMDKGDKDGKEAGKKLGAMTGISIDKDGMVFGSYDNGNTVLLAQIAVANFANASGLEKIGENCYQTTLNSGEFDGIGVEIGANGGSMTTGALEMSNVDLSNEFTDMITTQRGFQANSRIITTSDTLLEELINLKR